jgi:hypothetical protein
MQRMGGDESLADRLRGMFDEFGGYANPTGAVDFAESWSRDPFKNMKFRPNTYAYLRDMGARTRRGESWIPSYAWAGGSAQDQLNALDPNSMTIDVGFF